MMGACQVAPVPLWGWGWRECGQPAVAVHDYACVHEHVVRKATCGEHAPVHGEVGCRQCWDAGHDCPMTARLVPDA